MDEQMNLEDKENNLANVNDDFSNNEQSLPEDNAVKKVYKKVKSDVVDEIKDVKKVIKGLQRKIDIIGDKVDDINKKIPKDMENKKAVELNERYATEFQKMEAKLKQEKSDAIAELNASHKKAMEAKVAELEGIKIKKQEVDTIIGEWESTTAPYVEVQKALNTCPTIRDFLEKKNLIGEGIDKLISLIMALGKDNSFVSELHKFMTEEKKKSKKEMTSEEANMYYCLNQCFIKTCGIQYDLFVMPGNQNVKEKFNKVQFDKAQVENMNDPKNKSLKFTTSVYVPCLMSVETGGLYFKAQVKAGNS